MSSRTESGAAGEEYVAGWLSRQGYRVIGRNVRYRGGELDIVAVDGDELVFVEVRVRTGLRYGSAAESVDARKLATLMRTAEQYRERQPDVAEMIWRVDLVAITLRPNGSVASLDHHQNLTLD
ncbi:MAG TPA: YraN family protein [Thermomicrobiales bacterium]|jgi:putative endonuclease|nr:YraN family protein [Thermomicrobiales bacterium]HQZ90344.1 YraN family protein [Thermomicrobiales bacterium]HRA30744.1 YraN family protein [Thermomicrobiales bacterium]